MVVYAEMFVSKHGKNLFMMGVMMNDTHLDLSSLAHLNADQLRVLVLQKDQALAAVQQTLTQQTALMAQHDQTITCQAQELDRRQLKIDQLTHEMAVLKRWKFGRHREHLDTAQLSLLDETLDADIAAIELELQRLRTPEGILPVAAPVAPKRLPLPAHLPRIDIHHDPEQTCTTTGCGCTLQRIGEDISEKLDYVPGTFTVERHIRGKWVCRACETLIQSPVPAQIIDKGMATAGLLAQVLVAKYADHVPLYRQESQFERAGMKIARSTLAQWVGQCGVQLMPLAQALKDTLLKQSVLQADETPVAMLKPGLKKTHRAYLWAYAASTHSDLNAVVYDFTEGRSGTYAETFLGGWTGHLVCDDYSGYKARFQQGITEVGCMAHARRKFFDLHVSHQSQIAEQALQFINALYDIERMTQDLSVVERQQLRQSRSKPIVEQLERWMQQQRLKIPDGTATAKALDYSLKRWAALTRFVEDGRLPIDNNWVENQMRPIALGRKNWLFAGSLRAGQRAAAIMSLIQSAKMNRLDPYGYLKDVLMRLPTQPNHRIEELLPHRWAAHHVDSIGVAVSR